MAVMSPALQSFLRAYTTYPAHLKHVFHIRSLHLGHTAKSFGLRDAPQGLSAAVGGAKSPGKGKKQSRHAAKGQKEAPLSRTDAQGKQGKKRFLQGQRELSLLRSEFSSGLQGEQSKKKKKKKKKVTGEEEEEEEEL